MSNISIYTGLWFDHSNGRIYDDILTVPVQSGAYLISGLSVLVSIAAASAWKITAFALHQIRVKFYHIDALDLELQALLRNSSTAPSTIVDSLKMYHAWWKKKKRITSRIMISLIPALLIWIIFTVSGVFVANVTNKYYETIPVLAVPGNCGFFSFHNTSSLTFLSAFNKKTLRDAINARIYASEWYEGSQSGSPARSVFPVISLPYNVSYSEPCPFPSAPERNRCLSSNNTAFMMNTGPLDSHSNLGVNAPESDRVTYQKQVTCSPISTKEFSTSPVSQHNQNYVEINIGPYLNWNYTFR